MRSSAASGRGSPTHPIELDSHDSSEDVVTASTAALPAPSDSHGDITSSELGGDSSSAERPQPSTRPLLSVAARSSLPVMTVSRTEWIPGYADRCLFTAADVAPWALPDLLEICVRELTVDLLFQKLSKPLLWIFPADDRAPAAQHWSPALLTEANVRALYASEAWSVLDTVVTPVSFDLVGWFELMSRQYAQYEEDFRQAFWESTHVFPISSRLRGVSGYSAELAEGRKQRRSRMGARWKSFLRFVLRGLIAYRCDLDLFLDRFFLHLPRPGEKRAWYPGLGCNPAPADLIVALRAIDSAEPWRNQFRDQQAVHPSAQIARLANKFVPASVF